MLARTAGGMARFWGLGRTAMRLSSAVGNGKALQLAADRAGVENYPQLMLSHVRQTHSSVLGGEFVGSGYFAFAFHFAFVTGLLFPNFLQKAVANPGLFYAQEVSSSAGIAAGLTALMITGHMGVTAATAFRSANISEGVEDRWNAILRGGTISRAKFVASFLAIPVGKFPGVIKEGFSYKIDGESPLKVSASGPRLWDGMIAKLAWGVSIPLVMLAALVSSDGSNLPESLEWLNTFVHSHSHEIATRIFVPLAFISSLGKRVTNSGASKAFVVDQFLQEIGDAGKTTAAQTFDTTALKEQLDRGEE